MNHSEKNLATYKLLGKIVGKIIGWFLVAALIYWGYQGLSYLVSLPTITYWVVFAIVAISRISSIQTNLSNIKKTEKSLYPLDVARLKRIVDKSCHSC